MKLIKKIVLVALLIFVILIICLHKRESLRISSVVKNVRKNTTICGRLPGEADLKFDKKMWQMFETSKSSYRIMNAYLDDRENRKIVRVAVSGDRLNITNDVVFCQFWINELPGTQPVVMKASQFVMMWPDRM